MVCPVFVFDLVFGAAIAQSVGTPWKGASSPPSARHQPPNCSRRLSTPLSLRILLLQVCPKLLIDSACWGQLVTASKETRPRGFWHWQTSATYCSIKSYLNSTDGVKTIKKSWDVIHLLQGLRRLWESQWCWVKNQVKNDRWLISSMKQVHIQYS